MKVRLDHHSNYWGNKSHVPNHQPVNCRMGTRSGPRHMWLFEEIFPQLEGTLFRHRAQGLGDEPKKQPPVWTNVGETTKMPGFRNMILPMTDPCMVYMLTFGVSSHIERQHTFKSQENFVIFHMSKRQFILLGLGRQPRLHKTFTTDRGRPYFVHDIQFDSSDWWGFWWIACQNPHESSSFYKAYKYIYIYIYEWEYWEYSIHTYIYIIIYIISHIIIEYGPSFV